MGAILNNLHVVIALFGAVSLIGPLFYAYRSAIKRGHLDAKLEQLESNLKAVDIAKKNREYINTLPSDDRFKFLRSPKNRG